jgi:hypothetical protein
MTPNCWCKRRGLRVKVEVNLIFRGMVLPIVRAGLCERAQDVFTTDIEVPMLRTADLYGSKLVAAMDRQHPRDMFDAMKMLELRDWDASFIDCFVAYLAGPYPARARSTLPKDFAT